MIFKHYLGKTLVKNPFLYTYLVVSNCLFKLFLFFRKKSQSNSNKVSKVLISNIAHMGDCVIATSVIPIILEKYPKAQIGFLIGSWNKPLLKGHPSVKWIHVLDHPLVDRREGLRPMKIFQFLRSFKKTCLEVKSIHYDVAIDLQPFYPNSVFFLYISQIPLRIAYTSAGFSSLINKKCVWEYTHEHISKSYKKLFEQMNCNNLKSQTFKSFLPHLGKNLTSDKTKSSYVIFHPFSGDKSKEWDLEMWQSLSLKFIELGYKVIITGKGKREKALIDRFFKKPSKVENLCNQLSVESFSNIISGADLVITVDTLAGHLAAAFKVAVVSLHKNFSNACIWRPNFEKSKNIFPKDNASLKKVSCDEVFNEAKSLLELY